MRPGSFSVVLLGAVLATLATTSAAQTAQSGSRNAQLAAEYHNRGYSYKQQGDYKSALDWYEKALEVGGPDIDCYICIGDCHRALKQFRQAIPYYTQAMSMRSDVWIARDSRAYAYLGAGDYTHAAEDFRIVAEHEHSGGCWGHYAWALYMANRIPEAISVNRQILAKVPGISFVRFDLALCYAVSGNWSSARQEYVTALRHCNSWDPGAALQDVQDALAKHPNNTALRQAAALLKPYAR